MALATQKLTFEEFEAQYGNKTHEYWYGEAVPKVMPTWVHGLLQKIITRLLDEQGFFSAPKIELRIVLEARPRPDVVATRTKPHGPYPKEGVDVVVEILSEDDKPPVIDEHCQKYQSWGCKAIYIVDPSDRSIVEWRDGSSAARSELAGIPAERIWRELDSQYSG